MEAISRIEKLESVNEKMEELIKQMEKKIQEVEVKNLELSIKNVELAGKIAEVEKLQEVCVELDEAKQRMVMVMSGRCRLRTIASAVPPTASPQSHVPPPPSNETQKML